MHKEHIIALTEYVSKLDGILARFTKSTDGIDIGDGDDELFHQVALELIDLLDKIFGDSNSYSISVFNYYTNGQSNYYRTPSYKSVEYVRTVVHSVITKLSRTTLKEHSVINNNVPWGPVRSLLETNFSFGTIKEIVGLAGLNLPTLSHLDQKAVGGATKGQLMTAIDSSYGQMIENEKRQFLLIVTEEILKRKNELIETLRDYFARLGWTLYEGSIIPLEIFDVSELSELPIESKADIMKSVTRLRDGDLSGAISASCGAVDAVTTKIYLDKGNTNYGNVSFQDRVSFSLTAYEAFSKLEVELTELGWHDKDVKLFVANLKGSLNQAAYVMQTLRSKMGDVHGNKPVLDALVYDSLKWATIIIRMLNK